MKVKIGKKNEVLLAWVHFKMSRVGEDTNPGGLPWAVPACPVGRSSPPTFKNRKNEVLLAWEETK